MVIIQRDYAYLIQRYESLPPEAKPQFDQALVTALGLNPDSRLTGTITVVPDRVLDEPGACPDERLTRTLITKVFKAVTSGTTGSARTA